jgi:hypothetical protein
LIIKKLLSGAKLKTIYRSLELFRADYLGQVKNNLTFLVMDLLLDTAARSPFHVRQVGRFESLDANARAIKNIFLS